MLASAAAGHNDTRPVFPVAGLYVPLHSKASKFPVTLKVIV
jgi:hypothetical protein